MEEEGKNTLTPTALFVSPINSLKSSFQMQTELPGQCPIESARCEEYGANLESQNQVPRLLRNFPHFIHRLVWFNVLPFLWCILYGKRDPEVGETYSLKQEMSEV